MPAHRPNLVVLPLGLLMQWKEEISAHTDCDVLEVSTPELDDVVRLADRYGRTGG